MFFLHPLYLASQNYDAGVFLQASKEKLMEYQNTRDSSFVTFVHSELADTSKFRFHLPILMLKKPEGDCHHYMYLTPFIDKKFSPYNQSAFLKNKNGYMALIIEEGVYEEKLRLTEEWGGYPPYKEGFLMLIEGKRMGPGDVDFSESERFVSYRRLKWYSDRHPDVICFEIYNMPGIWGFRGNTLIKLKFTFWGVKELDGEEYYRDFLFPISPKGIENVMDGNSFKVVVTG